MIRMPLTRPCPICEREQRLVADHCHRTGLARALICTRCNNGLGMFQDSPKLLRRAIRYLRHFRQQARDPLVPKLTHHAHRQLAKRTGAETAFLLARLPPKLVEVPFVSPRPPQSRQPAHPGGAPRRVRPQTLTE